MAPDLGLINKTAVANLFAKKGVVSYYSCTCCMSNYHRQEPTIWGMAGCTVLDCSDEEVQKVFHTYVVVPEDGGEPQQTFKCLRCIFLGRDCFAVSCPALG